MRFKRVYIEITNVCNLSCKFCPKNSRKSEFMDEQLFEKIVEEIKPYTDYVYLHVMGEPLLHPQLTEFIDICQEKGLCVNLTTNGTLIKEKGADLLNKPSLRKINFSLHSFEANEYNGEMGEYLDNIFEFGDMARNVIISLRLWNLHNSNFTKNRFILDRIKQRFDLSDNIQEEITDSHGIKLKDNIFLQQAQSFEWPDIKKVPFLSKGFCYGLRNQVGILVDGTVIPCCLDSEGVIDLGNIKNTSLKDIIEGDRAKKMYNSFSNRVLEEGLCKTCGYLQKRL